MKKNILAFLAFTLSLTLGQSSALGTQGFVSCGDVYSNFLEFDKDQRGVKAKTYNADIYLGYVSASASWYTYVVDIGKKKTAFPKSVKIGQIAAVFGKYLKENPEVHHHEGRRCFMKAMAKAFPFWGD